MSQKQTIIVDLLDGVHPRECAKRHEITLHYIKAVANECGIPLPADMHSMYSPGKLTHAQRMLLKAKIEAGGYNRADLCTEFSLSTAMIHNYVHRWDPNAGAKSRRPQIADESASGSEVKGAQAS